MPTDNLPVKLFPHPFKNEEDVVEIGGDEGLTFENRVDKVQIYGNVDIELSQEGLSVARALKATVDNIYAHLIAQKDLPAIAVKQGEAVQVIDNPLLNSAGGPRN